MASAVAPRPSLSAPRWKKRSRAGFVEEISVQFTISSVAAGLIGGVALTGSAIAFGKLQASSRSDPSSSPAGTSSTWSWR